MKKSVFALLLTIITFTFAFAEDVIKVLSIYSDGQCTTVPLAGVDSLIHSKYDQDSVLHSEHSSSIIYAIDRNYSMPIASIDSIVIGEISTKDFDTRINEIYDLIDIQTELELDQFQSNLLSWLNAKDNIHEATINSDKDLITILFDNGLTFYINFQDMSIYEDTPSETNVNLKKASASGNSEKHYYDVSVAEKEEIIDKPKILYIKGMNMLGSSIVYTSEMHYLNKRISDSPVDYILDESIESLNFVTKNFHDYGLIVISQTHGGGNGSFMVGHHPDQSFFDAHFDSSLYGSKAIVLMYEKDIKDMKRTVVHIPWTDISITEPVYLIRPSLFQKKLNGNKQSIVYGNYCWSGELKWALNNTVIGFDTKTQYFLNWGYTVDFLEHLANGGLCGDFIKDAPSYEYDQSEVGSVIPTTNHLDSRQRYFSITTDEITKRAENGNPIITGTINGYNNLKDNLKYVAFCHEGTESFTPEDEDVIKIDIPRDKIHRDGTFEFEFQGEEPLKPAVIYGFSVGFEYGDNIYYGEMPTSGEIQSAASDKISHSRVC